jgi:flagellar biogenesis protein FliO
MSDLLVVILLLIGPLGIWLLMRFLNQPTPEARRDEPSVPPKD